MHILDSVREYYTDDIIEKYYPLTATDMASIFGEFNQQDGEYEDEEDL